MNKPMLYLSLIDILWVPVPLLRNRKFGWPGWARILKLSLKVHLRVETLSSFRFIFQKGCHWLYTSLKSEADKLLSPIDKYGLVFNDVRAFPVASDLRLIIVQQELRELTTLSCLPSPCRLLVSDRKQAALLLTYLISFLLFASSFNACLSVLFLGDFRTSFLVLTWSLREISLHRYLHSVYVGNIIIELK